MYWRAFAEVKIMRTKRREMGDPILVKILCRSGDLGWGGGGELETFSGFFYVEFAERYDAERLGQEKRH